MTYQLAVFLMTVVVCGIGLLVFWMVRSDAKSEPDGNTTYPTCYGDYPKYSSHLLAERECWGCVFNEQCKQRTRYE